MSNDPHFNKGHESWTKFSAERARVLDTFCSIEAAVDVLIAHGIAPADSNYEFVMKVVLNTSVMPFSGKLRVLRNLATKENWKSSSADWAAFGDVMELRNQFAHSYGVPLVNIRVDLSVDADAVIETDVTILIEKISGSGVLSRAPFSEAVAKFEESAGRVADWLNPTLETTGAKAWYKARQDLLIGKSVDLTIKKAQ